MKPILYRATVQSRFSDLDPYGHVNFKHYFDYVISSRLTVLENRFGLSLSKLAERGIGFYCTRGEINFLRPITGIKNLDIETHVESVKEEVTLIIPFLIKDATNAKVYADGVLHFNVIDITSGKSAAIDDETRKLFFSSN